MPSPHDRAAVLWTGGKDSSLALHEAARAGYLITQLVTFAPERALFRAHPLHLLPRQGEALGLPHRILTIREPFREAYEQAIRALRDRQGITTLITGDIAEVDGHPNWVTVCSRASEVRVVTPLWGRPRLDVLRQLVREDFHVIVSCVKRPWLTRDWVGRRLDAGAVQELEALGRRTGLDPCGEQGEYHTLVLDGPAFRKRLSLTISSVGEQGDLLFLDGATISVHEKDHPPTP